MSKLYEDDAQVVVRDGTPCFFVEKLRITDRWNGFAINVESNTVDGPAGVHWMMHSRLSPDVPMPDSPGRCILYGAPLPQSSVEKEALPLQFGTPYRIFIDTGDRIPHGRLFCLARRASGEIFSVETTSDGARCSDEPLTPEGRSVWRLLFGD